MPAGDGTVKEEASPSPKLTIDLPTVDTSPPSPPPLLRPQQPQPAPTKKKVPSTTTHMGDRSDDEAG